MWRNAARPVADRPAAAPRPPMDSELDDDDLARETNAANKTALSDFIGLLRTTR